MWTGVRLIFIKGSVVELKAETGEDFSFKQISMDKGARRVGEFSLTDRRFPGSIASWPIPFLMKTMAANMETAISH